MAVFGESSSCSIWNAAARPADRSTETGSHRGPDPNSGPSSEIRVILMLDLRPRELHANVAGCGGGQASSLADSHQPPSGPSTPVRDGALALARPHPGGCAGSAGRHRGVLCRPPSLDALGGEMADAGRDDGVPPDGRDRFYAGGDFPVLAFLRNTGEFVLGTGLHPRSWRVPKFEIGYWCRRSMQRKGYTLEAVGCLTRLAFSEMGAERLEILCDSQNDASRKVAEKAGYPRGLAARGGSG